MSRRYTVLNKEHPANKLNAYKQKVKEDARVHSTDKIASMVLNEVERLQEFIATNKTEKEGVRALMTTYEIPEEPLKMTRKEQIDFLVYSAEFEMKVNWLELHGFPFEDVHDQQKYKQHIAKAKMIEAEKQKKEAEAEYAKEYAPVKQTPMTPKQKELLLILREVQAVSSEKMIKLSAIAKRMSTTPQAVGTILKGLQKHVVLKQSGQFVSLA